MVTPFDISWERLRNTLSNAPIEDALGEVFRLASIYRPAALRRKIRRLQSEQRCGVSAELWIDVMEAASPDIAAYELGRVKWALDDIEGAIEAFARAKSLPEGEWAHADSLLWAGRLEEARSALTAVASGSSRYRPFARVLLDRELSEKGAASLSDYENADLNAESVFGDGPSRRNFAVAFADFRERSKRFQDHPE